jgi:hypothetical protein
VSQNDQQQFDRHVRAIVEGVTDALDVAGVTDTATAVRRLAVAGIGTTEQTSFTYATIAGTKYLASYVEAGQRVTIGRDTDGSVLSVTKGPAS